MISFCHAQEHGANHVHIMIVSNRPKVLLTDLVKTEINSNRRYDLEVDDKMVEIWIIDPSFTQSTVLRRIFRSLHLLIVDHGNLQEWTTTLMDPSTQRVDIDYFEDGDLNEGDAFWNSENTKLKLVSWIESFNL